MEISKEKMRQIILLMVVASLLALIVIFSRDLIHALRFLVGICTPFILGGSIAFVLNIPMKLIENKLLKNVKSPAAARFKRPAAIALSLLFILFLLTLLVSIIVPRLGETFAGLMKQIPDFINHIIPEIEALSSQYPFLSNPAKLLADIEANWESIVSSAGSFLRDGVGSLLSSTVGLAGSIISGATTTVIGFIFSLYILGQKETLQRQSCRLLYAYLPEETYQRVLYICSLLHKNFSSFITGQCLEAVILGAMFILTMTLLRMPYAVMIGVLIAFTALIPIVGAFIGCIIGAFLIFINSPMQALGFIVLFLALQQLEEMFIYPRVVGNSVGLAPIWILAAVSIGGSLFGVLGMLIFIPLLSTVYTLLREDVRRRSREKAKKTAG